MTGPEWSLQSPKRVLAIHRYYWPDTPPYATMLRRIVSQWVEDGHQVDVLSSQSSYKTSINNPVLPAKSDLDGATIFRLRLFSEAGRPAIRILNTIYLCSMILFRCIFLQRYDVIMVSTSPPVLAAFFSALAAKITGARFIYHCMDIHPEIGRLSGEFSHPWVFSVLQKMDAWSCKQANPVVVLSEDMKKSIQLREDGVRCRIEVINNFSLPTGQEDDSSLPFAMHQDDFNLIFAGNIGRFQGLDVLVDAIGRLKANKHIRLILMGDGVAKTFLEKRAKELDANVTFVGHQTVSVAKKAMQEAGAGFVSLIPTLYQYAYPSKTMTYLEQGCPLIVAVEADSQLAQEVAKEGTGIVVPVDDVDALAQAINNMASQDSERAVMKQRAMVVAKHNYAEEIVLPKWSQLINEQV